MFDQRAEGGKKLAKCEGAFQAWRSADQKEGFEQGL